MPCIIHIPFTLLLLASLTYASPIEAYYDQQLEQTPDFTDAEPAISSIPTYSLDTYPLLDNVQANSAQDAQALSNQNQYDQVQQVDQTLYQPESVPSYVQTVALDEGDDNDSPSCNRCQRRNRRRRY
ncbi:hypothetical protein K493DRAFT_309238 [Basidiobolus meristosporus CBS 931.73]|uniref:Uncharacterized protein n=1 Tax=Basidiobolus meristosporus CBS 931.73 TaxID=1314790 RepID=A0A1Y1WPE7_9FUNG|nr:hypothetical protein K493DRAFT_309238 [Basidiobolus meristosporus CBS 931.73]|eukprot:ORX75168.1 hypothetical protein K493DRAFT_309238 [Basidiobolus meristosporus CBS 931.73]